ncbi:MAG: HesB/IscA family protein [Candidatus Hydrothermarchaeales archaeon]
MVTITESASQELNKLMEKDERSGLGLRIFTAGFSCSGPQYGLAFDDKPKDGDEVLDCNGVSVFLDSKTKEELDGAEVDYIKSEYGEGFVVKNPNAEGGCGCGPTCESCG